MDPKNLPPEMVQKIRESLASGGPLPPGVVAVPGGQMPPPGAVPTGITAPAMPGAMHSPGIPHAQRAQARQADNPLPEGDAGLQILRNLSDCPIPEESAKLQDLMKKITVSDAIDSDVAEETLVKGLVVAIRANKHCSKQLRKRTVCIFDQDDKLQELHQTIQDETELLDDLNKQIQECVERGQKALNDRWDYAVKTYGLAPEKFSYQIDEEEGIIELVELRCAECKGATAIRKARQESAELVLRLQKPGGTKDDRSGETDEGDGPSESGAGESGEASVQEQEVPGVADSATGDGSDGDNGPGETE